MKSDFYVRAISKALGVPEADVTPEQRQAAKMVCFAAVGRYTLRPRTDAEVFDEVCEVIRLSASFVLAAGRGVAR